MALGMVGVPFAPTVHRNDDRTVMENLLGLDQQVTRDMTVRVNYVRKLERNRMKLQNTAIPFSATLLFEPIVT